MEVSKLRLMGEEMKRFRNKFFRRKKTNAPWNARVS